MVKKRTKTRVSAAERRIRALSPDSPTLDDAVKSVIAGLLEGVTCPPTDLVEMGRKMGVSRDILRELSRFRRTTQGERGVPDYLFVGSATFPPTLYGRARASPRDIGAHRKECAPRRGQCGARLRHACGRVPDADISVRGSTSRCTHAQGCRKLGADLWYFDNRDSDTLRAIPINLHLRGDWGSRNLGIWRNSARSGYVLVGLRYGTACGPSWLVNNPKNKYTFMVMVAGAVLGVSIGFVQAQTAP